MISIFYCFTSLPTFVYFIGTDCNGEIIKLIGTNIIAELPSKPPCRVFSTIFLNLTASNRPD